MVSSQELRLQGKKSVARANRKTASDLRTAITTVLGGSRLLAVDVGARGDIPGNWLPLDGIAHFISFDADPEACERLKAVYDRRGHGDMYRVVPAALAAEDGERTLYMTHSRGGSSFFPVDAPLKRAYVDARYLFPIEEMPLRTRHAGTIFDELGERAVDLMKLDIQGAELEVLSALGKNILSSMLAVQLEASFQPKAPDIPTYREIDAFMKAQGFELFDLRPIRVHRTKDGARRNYLEGMLGVHLRSPSVAARLWEADLIYFRTPEQVAAAGDAAALRKLLVCFCLYGFFTEALHGAEIGRQAGMLPAAEAEAVTGAILAWHRLARYRWRYGPGRLPRVLRWMMGYLNLEEKPEWWPYY